MKLSLIHIITVILPQLTLEFEPIFTLLPPMFYFENYSSTLNLQGMIPTNGTGGELHIGNVGQFCSFGLLGVFPIFASKPWPPTSSIL